MKKGTNRTSFTTVLAWALVLFMLAACGSTPVAPGSANDSTAATVPATADQAAEPVNLRVTVWTGNEAHLALLNQIAADYKAEHPNVSVQYETIPFGEYDTKLTVQLAGSNPPDAGWIVERSAPTFIEAGVLKDLGPTLTADTAYNVADFSSSAMQLWTRGDAVYGVPFSTSPFLILYNEDMFTTAGVATPSEQAAQGEWTWEALATAAKAIAAQAKPGTYGFESTDGTGYSSTLWSTIVPMIRANGGDAWNANGTQCGLASPEATKAMQLYHQMIFDDKSAVPPGTQADFFSGQSAMTIAQISRLAKLKDAPFKWGIAPLPSGSAGQPKIIGQAAFATFNASTHADAAADFIAFATNQQNVKQLAKFFPPARASVLDAGAVSEANPQVDAKILDQTVVVGIKEGTVLPYHAEFPKIDQAAIAAFDTLWTPDTDVPAALNGVCEAITPFLK